MTHYSTGQKPEKLNAQAEKMATKIVAHFKGKAIPVLSYQGLSGITAATAVMLAIHRQDPMFPFVMCYVRKEGEESHGHAAEWEKCGLHALPLPWVGCFIDDFICSGSTYERVKAGTDLMIRDFSGCDTNAPETVTWEKNSVIVQVALSEFSVRDAARRGMF